MQREEFRDRRIFERFLLKLPLRYCDMNSNRNGYAETCDISANGIGLGASEELSTHTPLDIWVHIPDRGEPLYTKGEVVWTKMVESNKYRIGIKFEKEELIGVSRALRINECNKTF